MKASEVVTAMRRRYGCEHDDGIGPEWASLDEFELTGPGSRRIDLLMVRAWSGKPKGHERHAIEVKVSRADLRREIDTGKWEPWADVVHRFYLAVPATLNLEGFDLPERWGIITVTESGTRQARRAPRIDDPKPLPERAHVEAFRRASRGEARIRSAATATDPAARIAELERAVVAAERATSTARAAERRWHDRADEALRLYADVAPQVWCRCGTPLRIGSRPFGRGHGVSWDHDGDRGMIAYFGRDPRPCQYASPDLDRLAEALAGAA